MNTKWAALGAALTVSSIAGASGFADTFDSINPSWVTDRYAPAGFSSQSFLGDNRLRIDISDADSAANRPGAFSGSFYNTQGRQRAASLLTPWEVSGDLYISDDMLTGANLRRTDLWSRDSNADENSAAYSIIGVIRNEDADPFNPNGSLTTRYRVWDADTANGWVDLGTAVTGGWHHLSMLSTGSAAEYRIDGNLVYTDNNFSALGAEALQTVFVEGYNFGGGNYSVYWDNITAAPVPEPATLTALGLGALAVIRRRKKK